MTHSISSEGMTKKISQGRTETRPGYTDFSKREFPNTFFDFNMDIESNSYEQ